MRRGRGDCHSDMAYCTVSIGSGLVDSLYGKSQFPIKSYLEKRGEAFEERSILKKLFRMETSKHWAEQYSGETAADDFEPVGEGGSYPNTGFEEGFPKAIINETWKSQFAITQELVEDGRLGTMKKRANKLITSYDRTREKFGRYLYAGGLYGITVKVGTKTFDCSAADGLALFSKVHPGKVDKKQQSNLFAGDLTLDNLSRVEEKMQNLKGDNGELLNIAPDTIWIPNDAGLKQQAFAAAGSDKTPEDNTNAFNYQVGRWNILVDPYLTWVLQILGKTDKPWFLLDSAAIQENDGPIFQDRVKLNVRSVLDDNNDNNLWKGRARFGAGFADWRFVSAGGMSGGTSLT